MVDSVRLKLRSTRIGIDLYRCCNATSMHKTTPMLPTPDNPRRVLALYIPPHIEVVCKVCIYLFVFTRNSMNIQGTRPRELHYTRNSAHSRVTPMSRLYRNRFRVRLHLSSVSSGHAGRLTTCGLFVYPHAPVTVMYNRGNTHI